MSNEYWNGSKPNDGDQNTPYQAGDEQSPTAGNYDPYAQQQYDPNQQPSANLNPQDQYGQGSYDQQSDNLYANPYGVSDPYGQANPYIEQSFTSSDPSQYPNTADPYQGANPYAPQADYDPYGNQNMDYQQSGANAQFSGSGAPLANWGQRALGGLVDYVGPGIVFSTIASLIQYSGAYLLGTLINYALILAWYIYNIWYLGGTTGQTWGRKVANIRLISETKGKPIGFGMALLRSLAHFVDGIICFVGYLFPLWDEKRQTLADKIVGTVVVDESAINSANPYENNPYAK